MKSEIGFVALIIAILAAGIFIASHEANVSRENYNNGICAECGGEYRFASATHIKNNGDRYYYTCESCGHTVMTFELMG